MNLEETRNLRAGSAVTNWNEFGRPLYAIVGELAEREGVFICRDVNGEMHSLPYWCLVALQQTTLPEGFVYPGDGHLEENRQHALDLIRETYAFLTRKTEQVEVGGAKDVMEEFRPKVVKIAPRDKDAKKRKRKKK